MANHYTGYKSFEDMPIWQKSMDLAVFIFGLTKNLPRKEDYGLTSQIRGSSLSVPGNIAEGYGRKHTKDKLNFYYDSRGFLLETGSHPIYARKVDYFLQTDYDSGCAYTHEILQNLNLLIKALQNKIGSYTQPQP